MTSQRAKDIIQDKRKNSKVYGKTPYGFHKVGNELVKNEYEIKVLRKIQNLRTKGNSYQKISQFLNKNNYKTKMGKKWSREDVYSLLKIDRNIIGFSTTNSYLGV